jgi:hypothetical protein
MSRSTLVCLNFKIVNFVVLVRYEAFTVTECSEFISDDKLCQHLRDVSASNIRVDVMDNSAVLCRVCWFLEPSLLVQEWTNSRTVGGARHHQS